MVDTSRLEALVNPRMLTASGSQKTSAGAGASSGALDENSFMTLLLTQLKGQDPMNPMDPTQFVSQLVQFNQLEQLIQINQALKQGSSASTGGSGSGSGTKS